MSGEHPSAAAGADPSADVGTSGDGRGSLLSGSLGKAGPSRLSKISSQGVEEAVEAVPSFSMGYQPAAIVLSAAGGAAALLTANVEPPGSAAAAAVNNDPRSVAEMVRRMGLLQGQSGGDATPGPSRGDSGGGLGWRPGAVVPAAVHTGARP